MFGPAPAACAYDAVTLQALSSHDAADERDDEQHDRDPKQQSRAFHRRPGDAAKSKRRPNEGDD